MLFKRKAKRKPIAPACSAVQKGFGYEMPPDPAIVQIYFEQKGMPGIVQSFLDKFGQMKWKSRKGTPLRNWKVLAADYIFDFLQEKKLAERLSNNAL